MEIVVKILQNLGEYTETDRLNYERTNQPEPTIVYYVDKYGRKIFHKNDFLNFIAKKSKRDRS